MDTWSDDDPRWELPAVLFLRDGRTAYLPDHTLKEALELHRLAAQEGTSIGGEIDPEDVESIGYREGLDGEES